MPGSRRSVRLLSWAVLALLAGCLAARTWRAWPDPLVDFGRELHAAWQVSLGMEPHLDLAWFNGPLSAWWNGAVFRLFGDGVSSLFVSNACWLVAAVLLLHHLLRSVAGELAAFTASMTFLALLAFTQLGGLGNYNWLAPYSHELTHGVTLALGAMAAGLSWLRRPAAWSGCVGLGLLTGLVLLTKVEVALASLAVFLLLALLGLRASPRPGRRLLVLLLCVTAPVLAAGLYLSQRAGLEGAMQSLWFPYRSAMSPEVRALPFYRSMSGLDQPRENLLAMLRLGLGTLSFFATPLALGFALRRARWRGAFLTAPVLGAVAALLLARTFDHQSWLDLGRGLPLFTLAIAGQAALVLLRHARSSPAVGFEAAQRARARLVLGLMASLLLSKMLLHASLCFYGFALAAPALALLAGLTAGWAPAAAERLGASGPVARSGAVALWVAIALLQQGEDAHWRGSQNYELGTGSDLIHCDGRGEYARRALADLEQRLEPGEAFLVLPEGVTLNYLARRPTVSRHLNFMPPELLLFGEKEIAEELREANPRIVVLVHKDTSEYGARRFGVDYAPSIGRWLAGGYTIRQLFGAVPFASGKFGIAILERDP